MESSNELNRAEQHEGAGQSVVGYVNGAVVVNTGQIDLDLNQSPTLRGVVSSGDDLLSSRGHNHAHVSVNQHDAVVGVGTVVTKGNTGVVNTELDDDLGVLGQVNLTEADGALVQECALLNTAGGDHGRVRVTGAANDLRMATETAMRIISTYGMSREAGLISDPDNNRKETVDLCKQMLDEQMDRTLDALRQKEQTLRRLAQALLERNHLLGHELEEILQEKE